MARSTRSKAAIAAVNPQQQEPPRLIDVPEVARLLGISERLAWKLVLEGKIASKKILRRRKVRRSAVDAFIAALPGDGEDAAA